MTSKRDLAVKSPKVNGKKKHHFATQPEEGRDRDISLRIMKTPILNLSIIIDLLEIIIHIDIIIVVVGTSFFPELFEPVRFPVRRVKAHEGTVVEERNGSWTSLKEMIAIILTVYIYMWVNYNISLT